MAAVLERIHRANRPSYHSLSPKQARIAYLMGAEILDLPRAPLPRIENLAIPGPAGTIGARLYAPMTREDVAARDGHEQRGLPVLLYFHGGGFVIGNLETHDSLCRQLALRSGAAVVAVDYRLAPEHPFPAAVDDCWAALAWLAQAAPTLGLDRERIAVGGDSAGGTLAAVTALHARDIREALGVSLALQLLITPGATAHADTDSHRRFAKGHLLEADTIAWFFNQYIPADRREDWRFAPLQAEDHDGLAPACFILAEADPLIDEGIAYADLLRASGNEVRLELFRGVTHDFIKMGRSIPEAEQALDACAEALRAAFGLPAPSALSTTPSTPSGDSA
ncbi:alpha/beta hydrolase [Roseateles sp. MS654]|uniref:alpha/beta hydrolase n=1 Tax=Roseateles sp. MS654 TaxID=3412685 RepID=UPI003C2F535C